MSVDTAGTESDFHFGSSTATSVSGNGDGGTSGISSDVDSDLEVLYESFDFEASLVQEPQVPSTPELMQPLYQNAPLTAYHSNLLLLQYAIRHSLTNKTFTELLQLMSVHLPPGSKVSKSVHHLKNFFLEAYPEAEEAVKHVFVDSVSGHCRLMQVCALEVGALVVIL